MLCCALLWLYIDWFSHTHQAYFTGTVAIWRLPQCQQSNMDKYFMWIHYEQLHNHNKAKHNKFVCILLGIYCISFKPLLWINHHSTAIVSFVKKISIWSITWIWMRKKFRWKNENGMGPQLQVEPWNIPIDMKFIFHIIFITNMIYLIPIRQKPIRAFPPILVENTTEACHKIHYMIVSIYTSM